MIAKVGGRWAFVSRRTHRPLAYWNGSGRPPRWWEEKQERRVQYFKRNPMLGGKEGFTEVDALVAIGSLGALSLGFAYYRPGATSDADQERNKLATSSMMIGGLAGALFLVTKAQGALK
jgi:hypothetical protein